MKICMVIPYDLAEEGGVKRHAMQLARSLRERGDEVDVVGPCSDPTALDDQTYGFRGVINIPSNGSANYLGIFACPYTVRRLFRSRRYDVVHVHEPLTPTLNYWALWNAGSAARVATFHSFTEQESTTMLRTRRLLSAIAFPSYDRGIAVSPAAARFAAVTFAKPLEIIPNGIRIALYPPTPPPITGSLRILFVGHWRDSRKGLPYLFGACTLLTRRGVAWTLDVVGDGGREPRSELPGVTYHGAIRSERQIADLYAGSDVFVSPATGMESFGIVLLEAMAAARSIVCSDIEGYRYAVGDGTDSGALLVAPAAAEPLADALAALAADPARRARMGEANRTRVARFDWANLVADVRQEYVAALASRGRADEPVAASQSAAAAHARSCRSLSE